MRTLEDTDVRLAMRLSTALQFPGRRPSPVLQITHQAWSWATMIGAPVSRQTAALTVQLTLFLMDRSASSAGDVSTSAPPNA
jgi:hypothetical protein